MNIDIHNHAIPQGVVELLRNDPIYRVTFEGDHLSGGNHVDFELTPDFYDPSAKMADLQMRGLDAAVISASPTIFYYEIDRKSAQIIAEATNAGLAEMAAVYPGRLRWMAHVPMGDPDSMAGILKAAVSQGASAVEIATSIAGRRLDETRFESFWALVDELELPVMLHPAYNEAHEGLAPYYFQNVIGNPLETTLAIERLICSGVLDRYPRVRVVLLHGAGYFAFQAGRLRHARTVRPELASAPLDPMEYRTRIFADSLTHDLDALALVVGKLGADNVMIGTDAPFDMGTLHPLEGIDRVFDAATCEKLRSRNAARLFGFQPQE